MYQLSTNVGTWFVNLFCFKTLCPEENSSLVVRSTDFGSNFKFPPPYLIYNHLRLPCQKTGHTYRHADLFKQSSFDYWLAWYSWEYNHPSDKLIRSSESLYLIDIVLNFLNLFDKSLTWLNQPGHCLVLSLSWVAGRPFFIWKKENQLNPPDKFSLMWTMNTYNDNYNLDLQWVLDAAQYPTWHDTARPWPTLAQEINIGMEDLKHNMSS